MSKRTPVSLLQRLRKPGADDAWGEFVDLYMPLLFFWARRLGQQDSDAADLVQDVFAALVRAMPTFEYDPGKGFRSWLRTVVLNRWRDRQRQRSQQLVSPEQLAGIPDAGGVDEEAEYRRYVINRALKLIQPRFQPSTWQAFYAHQFLGRPAADVARELQISVNAVYLSKSRVLRMLRAELDGLL